MRSTDLGAIMRDRLAQLKRMVRKWEVSTGFPDEDLPFRVRQQMMIDRGSTRASARYALYATPARLLTIVVAIGIVGLIVWLVSR
jgi:hypothetical protein